MAFRRFRIIKPEIRVLGIDDGVFVPHMKGFADVIGVVFRGGYWLDGVLHTRIEVDGLDATEKMISMILNSPHHRQLRVIVLNGVTFAGFNVVDVRSLYDETSLPVITVTRQKPDFEEIQRALKNLPESKKRWKLVLNAGEPYAVSTTRRMEKIYVQTTGITRGDAEKILRLTSTRSNIPEALRVAHLVASGISSI